MDSMVILDDFVQLLWELEVALEFTSCSGIYEFSKLLYNKRTNC